MKHQRFYIVGVMLFSLLAGCSTTPQRTITERVEQPAPPPISKSQWIARRLFEQYQQWRGTRYQIGGLSKKGIDCSGFVYLTFKSNFGLELPRSSMAQAALGQTIDKPQLRTGDLVFFRTGKTMRHVGVYLNNGQFLHASTRKGVMISDLNEDYWRSTWWKGQRVQG